MVLGVWLWAYGLALGVWLLGIWFWAYGFGRMVWLWAYDFGRMVIGVWFWAYRFGRIVWMYDFGGTTLQTRAGQAQKYTIAAIPDGQNPKNPSGIASDPGQQARLWCKEIQNLLRFACTQRGIWIIKIRDSGV